ncbi:hypothetical protein LB506_009881 [Fusarium annulatum]|nr:hypothetical protein LB506_009881 [Fusarium annulatum]
MFRLWSKRSDTRTFLRACVSPDIATIKPTKRHSFKETGPRKRMNGCRSGRYKKRQGSILPSHPMLRSPERPRMIGGIRRQNAALRLCTLSSTPWRLPHVGRGARSLL